MTLNEVPIGAWFEWANDPCGCLITVVHKNDTRIRVRCRRHRKCSSGHLNNWAWALDIEDYGDEPVAYDPLAHELEETFGQ